ncbi:hypothetical protein F7R12_13875 [Pseudomonas tolaasii]|nr:hypothetical protein F7R12_13875 [Pseudomonas tolaasii]
MPSKHDKQGTTDGDQNCGSGLAREGGVSAPYSVADTALSRASRLPQFDLHRSEERLTTTRTTRGARSLANIDRRR